MRSLAGSSTEGREARSARRLALFDIDGTLVTGAGTERSCFAHMIARGVVGPRQLFAFAAYAFIRLPRDGRDVFRRNKAWLAGLPVARVAAQAADWVGDGAALPWYAPCVARLRAHQAAGDEIVLMSGTPQFVADAIAACLGTDGAVGTVCARAGARFVAQPPLRHPFGTAKRALAEALAAERGYPPDRVSAYGDSRHDAGLLEWAGEAVAVRPDRPLRRRARRRGWEILAGGADRGRRPGRPGLSRG